MESDAVILLGPVVGAVTDTTGRQVVRQTSGSLLPPSSSLRTQTAGRLPPFAEKGGLAAGVEQTDVDFRGTPTRFGLSRSRSRSADGDLLGGLALGSLVSCSFFPRNRKRGRNVDSFFFLPPKIPSPSPGDRPFVFLSPSPPQSFSLSLSLSRHLSQSLSSAPAHSQGSRGSCRLQLPLSVLFCSRFFWNSPACLHFRSMTRSSWTDQLHLYASFPLNSGVCPPRCRVSVGTFLACHERPTRSPRSSTHKKMLRSRKKCLGMSGLVGRQHC